MALELLVEALEIDLVCAQEPNIAARLVGCLMLAELQWLEPRAPGR